MIEKYVKKVSRCNIQVNVFEVDQRTEQEWTQQPIFLVWPKIQIQIIY